MSNPHDLPNQPNPSKMCPLMHIARGFSCSAIFCSILSCLQKFVQFCQTTVYSCFFSSQRISLMFSMAHTHYSPVITWSHMTLGHLYIPTPYLFVSLPQVFRPVNYSLHMSPLIVGTGYTHIYQLHHLSASLSFPFWHLLTAHVSL